jgi:O-antigen/teichoic acid export membrane protein
VNRPLPSVADDAWATDVAPQALTRTMARGAVVSTGAQVATFVIRMSSLVVLARLLLKEDFGLVNMVTAFTGFLGLLRDAGLSMATVQRASITRTQTSTLFWVNVATGVLLASAAVVTAPAVAAFYGEPRLFWITVALGTSFLFHGTAAQHRAMLQRRMRFTALASVDMASFVFSTAAGIGMAVAGYGYWALVAMTIGQSAITLVGVWLATGWIPGTPRRQSGIRSMLAYGGAVSSLNLVVYVAYNLDKVLIGRFFGAEALGVYGRAYQLVNLPYENLHSTMGLVMFPALSRVQDDPVRLRHYFLQGYSLFLSLIIPMTIGLALFADDIVAVFLGSTWRDAAGILRLLAPAVLAFAFANPSVWLMLAEGRAGRCVRLWLLVTPALILGYVVGLTHGPRGVAVGCSVAMGLAIVPVLRSATSGTSITMRDIARAATPTSLSIAVGAVAVLALEPIMQTVALPVARLVVESTVLFGVYLFTLLFVMKQKSVYAQVLSDIGLKPFGRRRPQPGS